MVLKNWSGKEETKKNLRTKTENVPAVRELRNSSSLKGTQMSLTYNVKCLYGEKRAG